MVDMFTMIKKYFLVFAISLMSFCHAEMLRPPAKNDTLEVTEFELKNGLKVVLKPTAFDEGEFFLRIAALGGYANLPDKLRPAAESLHEVIWESGLGSLTGDQLSVYLFDNSLELNFKIAVSERFIEGEGETKNASLLFSLIKDLFARTKLNQDRLSVVRDRLKESIERKQCDRSCQFDAIYTQVNTGGYKPLAGLTVASLDQITYENLQKVFLSAFHDPSEFVLVITGDFSVNAMVKLVQETFEDIPAARRSPIWLETPMPHFPKGVVKEILPNDNSESLTRISFPIVVPIDDKNLHLLDLMVEMIESRLIAQAEKKYSDLSIFDVYYEFPIYLLMASPWITVQFHANNDDTDSLIKFVFTQLNDLKSNGPVEFDINTARETQKQSDEYWSRENHYWVSLLSQYYLMGWDKNRMIKTNEISSKTLSEAIKEYFPLDNYTIVSGQN